jgi:hypothetical protein
MKTEDKIAREKMREDDKGDKDKMGNKGTGASKKD